MDHALSVVQRSAGRIRSRYGGRCAFLRMRRPRGRASLSGVTDAHLRPSDEAARSRLEGQLAFYEERSGRAKRAYMSVKVVQIFVAAAIPVLAAAGVDAAWAGGLGGLLVALEALQQLAQWQTTWVLYRSTAEALERERALYLAHAGPYAGRDRHRLLAVRVEGLVAQEHAEWVEARHVAEADQAEIKA